MAKRPDGLVKLVDSVKPVAKFHSKAEAIGFVQCFGAVRQAREQLMQAEQQLAMVCSELEITDYDVSKDYEVNLDSLELREKR